MRFVKLAIFVCLLCTLTVSLTNVPVVKGATQLTLSGIGKTETTITLSWSKTNDVFFSNYALYQSMTGANDSFTKIWTSTDPSDLSYVVRGLSPNTPYYFYITDTGAFVGTTSSFIIMVITASSPFLSLTSATTNTASLSWTDYNRYCTNVPFQSYTIQVCTSGSNGAPNGTWSTLTTITNSLQNTFTVTGLGVGLYYFRIYDTIYDTVNTILSYSNYVIDPIDTIAVTPSTATTVQIGQQIQFSAIAAGGSGAFNYQWYSNGSAIPDATSAIFVFTPTSYGLSNIKVVAQDAIFNYLIAPLSSTVVPVTVTPTPISASISSSSTSVQVNQQTQFTVTAAGGTSSYIYKWFVNGAQQSATSATFTLNPTQAGNYNVYATVSDLLYPTLPLATSNSITVSATQPTPTPSPPPTLSPTPAPTPLPTQIPTQSPTQTPIPSTIGAPNQTPIPSVPEFVNLSITVPLLATMAMVLLIYVKRWKLASN